MTTSLFKLRHYCWKRKKKLIGQLNKDITIKFERSNLFVTLVFKTPTPTYWILQLKNNHHNG